MTIRLDQLRTYYKGLCTIGFYAALLISSVVKADEMLTYWASLDDQELEQVRGGFITDNGFRIALGFEDVVKVNGVLQTHTVVEIPRIAFNPREGNGIAQAFKSAKVTRLSLGNSSSPEQLFQSNSGLISLIQNSLDHQNIHHGRILNIKISGIGAVSASRFHSTLKSTVIGSLR